MSKPFIILGVDTALRSTGYGLIRVTGKKFEAIDCGVIKNSPKLAHSECLRRLGGGIREIAEKFKPDLAAIEGTFYMKNAKTAMILGMARGAVISVLAEFEITAYEYAPRKAKQVITGHGNADKETVARLMGKMLSLDIRDTPDDATDALSLAVCHALTMQIANGAHVGKPI
jgi:crossover junction endodeoxyribonuclease RuvC